MNSLKKYKPSIIFEWHPLLCKNTNNDWLEHFYVIKECGYDKFIWFDNYGNFSHVMTVLDLDAIDILANICLNNRHRHAKYFDVIALHAESEIDLDELSGLAYSQRNKPHC